MLPFLPTPEAAPCRPVADTSCLRSSVQRCSSHPPSRAIPPPPEQSARKQLLHAINDIRAAYGVGSLHGVSALRWVALSHSEDMVRRNYFAHTSPTGSTVAYRIQRSGFVSSYSWRAGETLAWGTGARASARATAEAWLKSSVHRAIMLSPTYRWVGIGRQCGRYRGYTDACFWTADFVIRW